MNPILQQKISEAKRISFDFDGVIISRYFGSIWQDTSKKQPSALKYFVDYLFSLLRFPHPYTERTLDELVRHGKQVYLLTGRDPKAYEYATKWLNKRSLNRFFNEKFHPEHFKTEPTSFKSDIVKFHSIDIHIDDNTEVIKRLSLDMPERVFILLGKSKLQFTDNVLIVSSMKQLQKILNIN